MLTSQHNQTSLLSFAGALCRRATGVAQLRRVVQHAAAGNETAAAPAPPPQQQAQADVQAAAGPSSSQTSSNAAGTSSSSSNNNASSSSTDNSSRLAGVADAPPVSPKTEAQLSQAQYQEIYDRLIKIFQERPREDWKRLIVFSRQWPQHKQGVFDR